MQIFGFNPFSVFTLLFMIMLIVLYGTCVEFTPNQSEINTNTLTSSAAISVLMLQETTVMMIIGFGFLYTLMRRYAWSGISFALFIAGLCGLWGALCNGFWGQVYVKYNSTAGVIPGALQKIPYSFSLAVVGQYSAATVLISWGCVIGRVSAMQILFMMVWEVIFSSISNWICGSLLMVTDPGGSMSIHTFGAAFGLAVAYVLGDKAKKAGKGPSTSRHNGTFAFLGCV
jgi:ammonium transporter Rh